MNSSSDDARRTRRRRRRLKVWARRIAILVIAGFAVACFSVWAVLKHHERGLPSTTELKHYDPPQVTRILARDGTLLAELYTERRTVVRIEQIPKPMKLAALAAEDADFYQHEGLDYIGMLRALFVNLRSARARQGGSTITQQVIKNVLLTPERTFARKAREVLLARRIEQELSKDEILELYLNHIYLGHGRYGVEEASRYYFGKSIANVTMAEAALIAGLAKGPRYYSPRRDPIRSRQRRDLVLEQMAQKGFATRKAVDAALATPVAVAPAPESLEEIAPEAVAYAKAVLEEVAGSDAARGGFTVETTIDPDLQRRARSAVRRNIDAYVGRSGRIPLRKKKGAKPFQGSPELGGHPIYDAVVLEADDEGRRLKVQVGSGQGEVSVPADGRNNPKGLPPSKLAEKGAVARVSPIVERGAAPDGLPIAYRLELAPQGALVAVDLATREVLALVGGYEATRGGFDRARFARRQPGSTFKPILYSYGLHRRSLTAASVLIPAQENDAGQELRAALLLRPALARSVNEGAVAAYHRLGGAEIVQWAQSLGLSGDLAATESLALGAYETTPFELANAYATLATGRWEPPSLVRRIVGPRGEERALPARAPARTVLNPAESYLIKDLMQSVVREGTARAAARLPFAVAGKTGTTNRSKDAWFAGFTASIACAVWTGFDDASPLGKRESGAKTSLPGWIAFVEGAHENRPQAKVFSRPDRGLVEVEIDPRTGLLPHPDEVEPVLRKELFLAGTDPTETNQAPPIDDPYAELDDASPAPVASSSPESPPF